MPPTILGLDIGGANLKAATVDKRAVSVPFPLWKNKDALPAALAELVAKFPDADQFAVTMTGELCDCYETKREGVAHILRSVRGVSRSFPVRVWGTNGRFHTVDDAMAKYLTVAAANWHALATFAGEFAPEGHALLIDIGSTTTDIIPLVRGEPNTKGRTDPERLWHDELVYTGSRRTPVFGLVQERVASELFATVLDAYLVLDLYPERPDETDTADGRPATRRHAHARLSRMLGGDPEMTAERATRDLAEAVVAQQLQLLERRVRSVADRGGQRRSRLGILSGSGEFIADLLIERGMIEFTEVISLTDRLGPELSACAPAYAVAVLAAERSL